MGCVDFTCVLENSANRDEFIVSSRPFFTLWWESAEVTFSSVVTQGVPTSKERIFLGVALEGDALARKSGTILGSHESITNPAQENVWTRSAGRRTGAVQRQEVINVDERFWFFYMTN
jgi:hypothetical protein